MDNQEMINIIPHQAAEGMVAFLMKRSIGIAVIKDNQLVDLGSGTGIEIGNRYFVSTAAHVINDYDDEDLWLIHTGVATGTRVQISTSCTIGGGPDDLLDLAFLELDPSSAAEVAKEFVTLDQIQVSTCHIPNDLVILNGYPSEFIDPQLLDNNELSVQSIAYHSGTFAPNEWPSDVSSWPRYAVSDTNILTGYPAKGNVLTTGAHFEIPDPHGMSGGGIWTLNITAPGLWAPTNNRLIGIMTEWDPSGRWVLGNQIQHWLAFVADEFPELHTIIQPYL